MQDNLNIQYRLTGVFYLSISSEFNVKNVQLFTPFKVSTNFTALWIGQTLASVGGAIMNVVIPILALSLHASTLTLGLIMTLMMLPQVLLLPFTGILADRMPRVPVMIVTDLIRFLLVATLAVLAAFHALHLYDLYTFSILFGAMVALFQPAYAGARAQIFTQPIRNAANSLTMGAQQLAFIIGPSIGGLLVGISSGAAALGVDALGFLISVISLFFVRLQARRIENPTTQKSNHPLKRFSSELMRGFHELRKHQWLWITILVFAFINIADQGIVAVLLPWLIKIHLELTSFDYGLVTSASGIGAIVTSVIFGHRSKWHKRGLISYLGIAISGLGFGMMAISGSMLLLTACMAVSGAGLMLFGLVWEGSLQELVPEEAYGRVSSLDMFGSYGLLPLGYLLTGWVSQSIGGVDTIMVEAVFIVAMSLLSLGVAGIRKFD